MAKKKSKQTNMQSRILSGLSQAGGVPMDWQDLAEQLAVPKRDYGEFKQVVDRLHRDGRVIIGEDKSVHLPPPGGRMIGTYRGHEKGFGFVIPVDPSATEDLYIPAGENLGAVTGDTVCAKVSQRRVKGRVRTYGKIEKILSRGKDQFVGTLFRAGDKWLVQTDGKVLHQPIVVDDVRAKGGRANDRVVVRLTEYPKPSELPRGVVTEVLGAEGEYETEHRAVIRAYDLPDTFGASVEKDLDRVIDRYRDTVTNRLVEGKLPRGRVDLRNELIVTIDPTDSRDFDDAFAVRKIKGGFELSVHIADVATLVRAGSALDREAAERGNSVYLPRKVLPMLPEALSNGLCSLQQDQDRLTKSVFIRYDGKGKVVSSRFANAVIRSKQRLTYEQATDALNGRTDGLPGSVVTLLKTAETLARTIEARRRREGMLHLDLPEVELEYNDDGEVIDAHPADTSYSHTLIEMFMVEANEAVARLLDSYDIPFIRRLHDEPEKNAFQYLADFLSVLGIKAPKNPTPSDLQALIDSVAGGPKSYAVSYAVLRSLQRAEYSIKSGGHYALASRHYCHFTSPIRRYPDLTVHRLLQLHLTGKLKGQVSRTRELAYEQEETADHCSFTERRAESAERQLRETLILQLLSGKIGQEYDGVVNGVCSLGVFVQLNRFLIEGLVALNELGSDFWEIDTDRGIVSARHSGVTVKIGDPMKVAVVSVDSARRRMNLAPAEALVEKGTGTKKTSQRKGAGKRRGKGRSKRSRRR